MGSVPLLLPEKATRRKEVLIPRFDRPELWYLWIDLPTDMTCWYGSGPNGELDKEEFTRLFILALARDDFHEIAEMEREILWIACQRLTTSST